MELRPPAAKPPPSPGRGTPPPPPPPREPKPDTASPVVPLPGPFRGTATKTHQGPEQNHFPSGLLGALTLRPATPSSGSGPALLAPTAAPSSPGPHANRSSRAVSVTMGPIGFGPPLTTSATTLPNRGPHLASCPRPLCWTLHGPQGAFLKLSACHCSTQTLHSFPTRSEYRPRPGTGSCAPGSHTVPRGTLCARPARNHHRPYTRWAHRTEHSSPRSRGPCDCHIIRPTSVNATWKQPPGLMPALSTSYPAPCGSAVWATYTTGP